MSSIEIRVFADAQEAGDSVAALVTGGKKLVTTNGCFDVLHAGHVQYLREAAELGDILLVGVNADSTVRRLKGEGRPLQPEQDRALVVASLKMVYGAFVFREDDPRAFVEILKPNIHVKGGDYTQDIIERETVEKNDGEVRIVSFLKGRSTTGYINKLRAQ